MKKINIFFYCIFSLLFHTVILYGQVYECGDQLSVTTDHLEETTIEATEQILSNVKVEPLVKATYKAGVLIKLADGFHAKPNCDFHAFNEEVVCSELENCINTDLPTGYNETSNSAWYVEIVNLVANTTYQLSVRTELNLTPGNIVRVGIQKYGSLHFYEDIDNGADFISTTIITPETGAYTLYIQNQDSDSDLTITEFCLSSDESEMPTCNPEQSINYECGLPDGISSNCLNNWGFSENTEDCDPNNWLSEVKMEEFKNYVPTASKTGEFKVGMNLNRIEFYGSMLAHKNLFKSTRHWSTYDINNPPVWQGGQPDNYQCNDNFIQLDEIINHANASGDPNLSRFSALKIQRKNDAGNYEDGGITFDSNGYPNNGLPKDLRILDQSNSSVLLEKQVSVQTMNLAFNKPRAGLSTGGNYAIFFEGKGEIKINGAIESGTEVVNNGDLTGTPFSIKNLTGSKLRGDFVLTNPESSLIIKIVESDDTDYIRNIEVYKVENNDQFSLFYNLQNSDNIPPVTLNSSGNPTGSKYYDHFINRLSEFPILRFMNLFRINHSTVTETQTEAEVHRPDGYYTYATIVDAYNGDCPNSDNPNPCSDLIFGGAIDACYSKFPLLSQKGAPLSEVKDIHQAILDKTNKHVDIWFNIPHGAGDNYVKEVGKFFAQQFDDNTTVYLEYSNEVWNTKFTQHNEVAALGQSNCVGIANADCINGQVYSDYCIHNSKIEYANRCKEIFSKFKEGMDVVSGSKPTLKRVLASKHGQPIFLAETAKFFLPDEIDVFSVGGYVHPNVYSERDYSNNAESVLDDNGDPVLHGNGQHLNINSTYQDIDFWTRRSIQEVWEPAILQCKRLADCFDAELMLYEGGQHLLNSNLNVYIYRPNLPNGPDESYMLTDLRVQPQVMLDYQNSGLMTSLYRDWFNFLKDEAKIDGILAYSLASEPNDEHGSWGHINNIFQEPCTSNKYPVLMEYNLNHNGSILYQNCLNPKINRPDSSFNFQLYPNPFSDKLTLHTEKEKGFMRILEITGRVLLQQKIEGLNTIIDTPNLKPGYYLVEVEQNGNIKTIKIIKN